MIFINNKKLILSCFLFLFFCVILNKMRIIAGKFKGRKIDFTSDVKTRPTADMVREALFCKIQFQIPSSTFLDLFAGSGSVGLEALSRSAKEVFFVDNNRKNIEVIKKNLQSLYGEDYLKSSEQQGQKINLISSDFLTFLDKLENTKFDFVYIDPPYKSGFYKLVLQKLIDKNLITNESLVICESDNTINFENYELISEKKYGFKHLFYLKLKN